MARHLAAIALLVLVTGCAGGEQRAEIGRPAPALAGPAIVDGATTSAPLHFAVHLVLFAAALCLWSPVLNRAPELPRMRSTGKMLYLMANGFLPVPVVAALALAGSPIYSSYVQAPRLWGISALDDQQLAAGAMWMLESFWTLGAVMIVFFDWWRNEQRNPDTASLPEHIRHRRPAAVGS